MQILAGHMFSKGIIPRKVAVSIHETLLCSRSNSYWRKQRRKGSMCYYWKGMFLFVNDFLLFTHLLELVGSWLCIEEANNIGSRFNTAPVVSHHIRTFTVYNNLFLSCLCAGKNTQSKVATIHKRFKSQQLISSGPYDQQFINKGLIRKCISYITCTISSPVIAYEQIRDVYQDSVRSGILTTSIRYAGEQVTA